MRFLVNAPAGLRPNRMQRPTAALLESPEGRRAWGQTPLREAQRIYDRAFSKELPEELRPAAKREKLPAAYDRAAARREYLAALRAPLKEAKGLRRDYAELEAAALAQDKLDLAALGRLGRNTPKRRRGKAARTPVPSEARNMARRRSKSRRRSTARRPRRRAAARVTHSNPPRKHRRRASSRRAVHRGRRRSFHRNPMGGGFFKRILGAFTDGLSVTGGVLAQNAVVRYVPNIIPMPAAAATDPKQAALFDTLNKAVKDVLGIVAGSWGAHKILGPDRARFVVAGQAHAAIARGIRAASIPTVSTLLGEYDPIRLGTYSRGTTRALPAANGAAAAAAGNVRTLRNVGVYVDGVSFAPSLY